MKPVSFKEANIVYAKDQPEYLDLPAFKNDSIEGEVISCWELNEEERKEFLKTGKIWLTLLSFNTPLTPSRLSVFKKDVFPEEKP